MNKIDKNSVIDYLLLADNDTLVEMSKLIEDCLEKQSTRLRYILKTGDKVTIHGTPRFKEGTVSKVNRTRAVVDSYCEKTEKKIKVNVPFSMITINKEG
tara:strand:+ start:80 stop:376 length:297 start_codon:yes stop_codon:yes gene_type:complete